MADFELAVAKTIANEGFDKYTETEGDQGGATKYGISSKFIIEASIKGTNPIVFSKIIGSDHIMSNVVDIIKNLTLDQAKLIYKHFFWDANRYGEIEDQFIAEKVFDMSVLMGAPRANKYLQISVCATDDGIIGIECITKINTFCKNPASFGITYYGFKIRVIKHFI